jgi:hypothetical protein
VKVFIAPHYRLIFCILFQITETFYGKICGMALTRREFLLALFFGGAAALTPVSFAWAVGISEEKEIEKAFIAASRGGKRSVVNCFVEAARLAGIPEPDFLTIGYIEGSLKFNPPENAGATGSVQMYDDTFITLVADYGHEADLRKSIETCVPRAGNILDRVASRIPRDRDTGTFLFDRVKPTLREEILSLRKMGGFESAFIECSFAAKDIVYRHEKLQLPEQVAQNGIVFRWLHKWRDNRVTQKRVEALDVYLKKRAANPKIARKQLEVEAERFQFISREIEKHLGSQNSRPKTALGSRLCRFLLG